MNKDQKTNLREWTIHKKICTLENLRKILP